MSLRKPPRLQRGDLIGVISPAAAVEAEALRHGCEALERLGFAVRVGPHALDRQRFLAGTDQARASELTAMFRDPLVHAIFCSRAGYGSGRLPPFLDFPAPSPTAKIFLGYSGGTLVLTPFVQESGLARSRAP